MLISCYNHNKLFLLLYQVKRFVKEVVNLFGYLSNYIF